MSHAFYRICRVAPEEHRVVVVERCGTQPSSRCVFFCCLKSTTHGNRREKLTQILFETYNVWGIYLINSAIATLYAVNRTTGIVVDIGASVVEALPVYNGKCCTSACRRSNLGGNWSTNLFLTI